MEQLVNLAAILLACFSIGDQLVAWWNFQSFISRTPEVHKANQLSFASGILMMLTILVILMQHHEEVTLLTFILIAAAIAELVSARLVRKDIEAKSKAIKRELRRISILESRLRIMQRNH